MAFAEHLISFGCLELVGRKLPTWPTPKKIPSTECLMSLPGKHHFIHIVTPLTERSAHPAWLYTEGSGSLNLVSYRLSPTHLCPMAELPLCPFFVINLSREHKRMSSVSVASESPAWGEVGLGNPWHRVWPCWLPHSGHGIRRSPLTAQEHTEVGWNGLLASGELQLL